MVKKSKHVIHPPIYNSSRKNIPLKCSGNRPGTISSCTIFRATISPPISSMPRIRFSPLKIRDIRSQPRVARFFFRPSSSVEPSAYPYCQKRDDNDKGIIGQGFKDEGIISLALDSYHRSTSHFNNICK